MGPVTVGRKPKQIQRSVCSVSLGQVRGSNCNAWACSKIMETEHRCVAGRVRYIRGRCREIIRSDGTPDLFFAITHNYSVMIGKTGNPVVADKATRVFSAVTPHIFSFGHRRVGEVFSTEITALIEQASEVLFAAISVVEIVARENVKGCCGDSIAFEVGECVRREGEVPLHLDLELCTGQGLTSSALRDLSDAEHDGVTIDPVEYALERRVFASLSVLSEKLRPIAAVIPSAPGACRTASLVAAMRVRRLMTQSL